MFQLGLADTDPGSIDPSAIPVAGQTSVSTATGPHQDLILGLLIAFPTPDPTVLANFLSDYSDDEQTQLAQELITNGVDPDDVNTAMNYLSGNDKIMGVSSSWIWGTLTVASAAASSFHGFKRNHGSIAWGGWWGLMGLVFPVATPTLGVFQGFAKPKAK